MKKGKAGEWLIDPSAFQPPLTHEAKYWFGFLMADGCVRAGLVTIGLHARDFRHLELFAKFLDLPCDRVRIYSRHAVLNFSGKPTTEYLATLGFVPNKSLTADVLEEFTIDRDFWRGMVDGDGALSITPRSGYQLGFGGSYSIVEKFQRYTSSVTGKWPTISKNKSIFHINTSGATAQKMAGALYTNSCRSLKRKQILADAMMAPVPKRRLISEVV